MDTDTRGQQIRAAIRDAESELVARRPVLKHQDALGALFFTAALSGMVGLGWLFAAGRIPWYVCLAGNAFFASILHEIEHDLIHGLYFKRHRAIQNGMMFLVWVFRGNVVHGWYRRRIHLHHHRASGTSTDVEERILGLGTPWGLRRLLMTVDGAFAFLLNARRLEREVPGFSRADLAFASFPVYPIFVAVLAGFLLGLPEPHAAFAVLAMAWVFPNYLRQASLQLISSNLHYYGDISSIHDETQILRPWYLLPFQLFCFNFGTTHAFHHYVVEQPFYIRQLISRAVLPELRAHGVRFNDTGTFRRANTL